MHVTVPLPIVEAALDAGGPAAYEISIVISLWLDPNFREAWATELGFVEEQRHCYNLTREYACKC